MDLSFDLKLRCGSFRTLAMRLLLTFTAAAIIVLSGCGKASAPNNPTANANRSIPTNTATNTMANAMSNSARPEDECVARDVVDADALRCAMKDRLIHDNEHFMPDGGWKTDAWLDTNVGAFYKNDDETAKLMVCDITDRLLSSVHKKLKPFARQKLYNGVSGNTKCRAAVDLMFKATLNATRIDAVP